MGQKKPLIKLSLPIGSKAGAALRARRDKRLNDSIAFHSSNLAISLNGIMAREDILIYVQVTRHCVFYIWRWGQEWQVSVNSLDVENCTLIKNTAGISHFMAKHCKHEDTNSQG